MDEPSRKQIEALLAAIERGDPEVESGGPSTEWIAEIAAIKEAVEKTATEAGATCVGSILRSLVSGDEGSYLGHGDYSRIIPFAAQHESELNERPGGLERLVLVLLFAHYRESGWADCGFDTRRLRFSDTIENALGRQITSTEDYLEATGLAGSENRGYEYFKGFLLGREDERGTPHERPLPSEPD